MHKFSLHICPTLNPIVRRYALVLNPSLDERFEVPIPSHHFIPMNFIIWNCRGSRRPDFRRNFRELLYFHKPALVVLLETY